MACPNILLVVIDSARADRFSCYGYEEPTTPNMDQIAAEGVRFDEAYSESSWTLPQAFTLLTGLAPREHRGEVHRKLPAQMPTLPEVLKRQGYHTFAAAGNNFLGPRCGLHRGFDQFFMPPHVSRLARPFIKHIAQRLGWSDEGGQTLTTRFVRELPRLKAPWFALIWYNDVHHPYIAKKPYMTKFCHQPLSLVRRLSLLRRVRRAANFVVTATKEDLDYVNALYNGGLAYVDMLVGQLRQALEQLKEWDDTVVIITADHGEMLGERRLMGHGAAGDMYRPLLRIPLVVRAPGLASSGTCTSALVQLSDITWSIASLTGVSDMLSPTGAEHADLLTLTNNQGRPWALSERDPLNQRRLAHAQRRNPLFDFQPHICHMAAVVRDGWRLIYRANGCHELYNLRDDPDEQNDLLATSPQPAAALMQIVQQWQQQAIPHPATQDLQPTIDPRVEKRLHDLGYF